VWTIDVDDIDALTAEVPAQAGAVGPRPLDTDAGQMAVAAHPLKEFGVARLGSRELPVTEPPSLVGEDEGVVRPLVTVDAPDDNWALFGHDVGVLLVRGTTTGTGGQNSDEASVGQVPMRSRSARTGRPVQ
jgi:hypothetical protein